MFILISVTGSKIGYQKWLRPLTLQHLPNIKVQSKVEKIKRESCTKVYRTVFTTMIRVLSEEKGVFRINSVIRPSSQHKHNHHSNRATMVVEKSPVSLLLIRTLSRQKWKSPSGEDRDTSTPTGNHLSLSLNLRMHKPFTKKPYLLIHTIPFDSVF